jgi:hypothetical protein
MPEPFSLVFFFDFGGGGLSDGVGSPPAVALPAISSGAAISAIRNVASIISRIVNLVMRRSC